MDRAPQAFPARRNHLPLPGTRIKVWRLEPDGTWTPTLSFGGAAIGGALATDRERVGIMATERTPDSDGAAQRQTALSSDDGRTFTVDVDPADVGDECYPGLALLGSQGVLACDEPAGPKMRNSTLW